MRGVQKSPLNEIKDCTETGKNQPKQPSPKHPKSAQVREHKGGRLIHSVSSQPARRKAQGPLTILFSIISSALSNLVPMHSSCPRQQRDYKKYKFLNLWKMIWASSIDLWVQWKIVYFKNYLWCLRRPDPWPLFSPTDSDCEWKISMNTWINSSKRHFCFFFRNLNIFTRVQWRQAFSGAWTGEEIHFHWAWRSLNRCKCCSAKTCKAAEGGNKKSRHCIHTFIK